MKRCNLYLRMLFLKYTEHFIRKTAPHKFNSPKINHKLLVSFCIFQNSSRMGSCHRIHKRQYILQYYCFYFFHSTARFPGIFYIYFYHILSRFSSCTAFLFTLFYKKLLSDCILSQLKGVLLLFASSVTTLYFNCSGSSTS